MPRKILTHIQHVLYVLGPEFFLVFVVGCFLDNLLCNPVTLRYIISCYIISCYVISCYVVFYHIMIFHMFYWVVI